MVEVAASDDAADGAAVILVAVVLWNVFDAIVERSAIKLVAVILLVVFAIS